MADDLAQQLIQMQAMINSAASGGKPSFLFGVIPLDWDSSGSMALKALSPLDKPIAPLLRGPGKQGGIADKFLNAIASIPEDLRKRASEAGVMYAGAITAGDGMPQGGSGISAPSVGGGYDLA